jgi:hypothetical protein
MGSSSDELRRQDAARGASHSVASTRELLEAMLAGTHDPDIESADVVVRLEK